MRKLFFVASLLILILQISPAQAYFCWGDDKRDPRDLMRDADVVFSGKVQKLESMGIAPDELKTERTNVAFRLDKVWKGLDEKSGHVAEVDAEAFYEYNFKLGESYLIYGYRIYPGRTSIIGCPRIQTVAASAKAIRTLGTPAIDYASSAEPAKASKPKAAKTPAEKPQAESAPAPAAETPAAEVAPTSSEASPSGEATHTEELQAAPAQDVSPPEAEQKMDEKSVDNLLDELQNSDKPVDAQQIPTPAPVSNVPAEPLRAPAPANTDQQLDVIWEEGKPGTAPAPAPAPVVPEAAPKEAAPSDGSTEQLDVIWEDGKEPQKKPAPVPAPATDAVPPMAPEMPEMPVPPMPAPPPPAPPAAPGGQ